VRYEIDGPLRHITHCHCSQCRKQHGAAFATYAPVARRRFRIGAGEDLLVSYASSAAVQRQFCRCCGSSLFWSTSAQPETISIALGTLDDDPGGRPEAHIYAASAASWYEISDPLPRFAGDVEP
jgi:hypothetical protein